jgi:hypothetical protein
MSDTNARCDDCGRFMNPEAQGTSTAEVFDFAAMEPSHTHWRCPRCTEKHGHAETNAMPSNGNYSQYETFIEANGT